MKKPEINEADGSVLIDEDTVIELNMPRKKRPGEPDATPRKKRVLRKKIRSKRRQIPATQRVRYDRPIGTATFKMKGNLRKKGRKAGRGKHNQPRYYSGVMAEAAQKRMG